MPGDRLREERQFPPAFGRPPTWLRLILQPALKFALRLSLSLGLAGVLLYLLSVWGGLTWADVRGAWARMSPATLALGMTVHAGIYALRALRFGLLLPPETRPPLHAILACSSAHNLAAYVLPAKTGEASLVVYLKSVGQVPGPAGLASLVLSRLLDLAVLFVGVGGAMALLAPVLRPEDVGAVRLLGLALAAPGAFAAFLCTRPELLTRIAGAVLRGTRLRALPWGAKVLAMIDSTTGALQRAGGTGVLVRSVLLTGMLWGLVFLFYAILARGAGLPGWIGYPEAVFGASLAVLFNLAPINGFAGFGTQEAGWKIGFVMLGVAPELALSTGIVVHLVQLGNVVIFGVLGHLAMGVLSRRRAPVSDPTG